MCGHFALQPGSKAVLLGFEIVTDLQVHPEPLGGAKVSRQPQGSVRSDRPLSVYDFIDAPCWNADALREPVLGDAQWLEEFLEQNLARMDRWMGFPRELSSASGSP